MRTFRAIPAIALVCVTTSAIAASPAYAGSENFAAHVGPVYSGQSWTNWGIWHYRYTLIAAASSGTAYSGAWLVNSSGVRQSAAAYCNTPGCTAYETWSGPYPQGYPTLHNHGNASPSWFYGSDDYL